MPALRLLSPPAGLRSSQEQSQVQFHRLLSVLGAVLVPIFGLLYASARPEATDPFWARLAIGGLFACLFGASYVFDWIRSNYIRCMRAILYITVGWFAALIALNGFAGDYSVGFLLVYAALAMVVGLGAKSLRPVAMFLAFGLGAVLISAARAPEVQTSPTILIASVVTVALVGGLTTQGWFATRRELRQAKREAEQASQMKSAMLSNMSHELRTPLTSIIGFAGTIADEADRLEGQIEESVRETLQRFAQMIEQSGARLMRTLEAIMDLSRLEGGEIELASKPIDLAGLAGTIAKESKPEIDEKGIRLELETRQAYAFGDESALEVVIQNLLSNAVKYTNEGGKVWVRTASQNGKAVLEIEDTGIGISEEAIPKVFEPFRQESEGMDREYEGTGLGLTLTRQAVEQMEGEIELHTEKGKGSRFTVSLPKADGHG